jgi:hypothetical protein
MLDDQHPPRPAYGRSGFGNRQHDDRADIARAREAAAALFRPKPTPTDTPTPDAAPQDSSARRPRVLAAAPPLPPATASADPPAIQPETAHEIPASEFARIRAWVAYGTTVREIAEMYRVPVEDVRRILRNP